MSENTAASTDAFDADVTPSRNDARRRYELHVGTELAAVVEFRELPGHINLVHTQTQDGFEGRALASVLVRYALDDVVASGKRIIPDCSYVAHFAAKHPELYQQYCDFPTEVV